MAEPLRFHRAYGPTAGCLASANELRAAGHVVHAPDLYDDKTLTAIADARELAETVEDAE
jgi:hypothetical protein